MVGAIGVGMALVVAIILLAATGSSEPTGYRVVVPEGTGARIADGESVDLIDADLRLAVGDRLVIENRDDQLHQVGPFPVRAGETFDHQFRSPGIFEGECSIHPDNRVVITVS